MTDEDMGRISSLKQQGKSAVRTGAGWGGGVRTSRKWIKKHITRWCASSAGRSL